jgi:hypothetical protein
MLDNWEYKHNYLDSVIATPEKRSIRIELCDKCDKLTTLKFCSECNCFMPAKTWVETRKCPLEKW